MSCEKRISLSPVKSGIGRCFSAGALFLIRLYQRFLSPLLGNQCRFFPSCSHYALDAFSRKPFWTACGLTLRRLLKCHPFHPGGYDPLDPDSAKSERPLEKNGEERHG